MGEWGSSVILDASLEDHVEGRLQPPPNVGAELSRTVGGVRASLRFRLDQPRASPRLPEGRAAVASRLLPQIAGHPVRSLE